MVTAWALEADAVSVSYVTRRDWRGRPLSRVQAVDAVGLRLARGETLGLLGESGSGKTTLAHVLVGLIRPDAGTITLAARNAGVRPQIVLQDPQSSLNPRLRCWDLITEGLAIGGAPASQRRAEAERLGDLVGIRRDQLDRFAHAFSGGQRQRIAIARALALEPEVLVLDEPTSALDVSVQAQVLNLLVELQQRLGLSYVFVSHDIGVIRHMSDRIAVMWRGRIVEAGPAAQVLDRPAHDYTRRLLASAPRLDPPAGGVI